LAYNFDQLEEILVGLKVELGQSQYFFTMFIIELSKEQNLVD
jgi:hypothetical protein